MSISHLSVTIRGVKCTPRKLTMIPKRYIWISDTEVLHVQAIPLLLVQAETPRSEGGAFPVDRTAAEVH